MKNVTGSASLDPLSMLSLVQATAQLPVTSDFDTDHLIVARSSSLKFVCVFTE